MFFCTVVENNAFGKDQEKTNTIFGRITLSLLQDRCKGGVAAHARATEGE